MAKVKIQGHASGTGVITVTAPNTSTDRTITLPDATGTLATTADTTDLDGAITINESGADVDFRVESDTNANSLFVQGSNGAVGLGVSSIGTNDALHIENGESYLVMKDAQQMGIKLYGDDTNVIYSYDKTADSITGGVTWNHADGTTIFYTGGLNARMTIDSTGRVTMPNQPAFEVAGNGGNWAANTVGQFDDETFDIGSNFNTSTYRFTAPIAGVYYFSWGTLSESADTTQYSRIRKNGSSVGPALERGSTISRSHWSQTHIMVLAANDYVDIYGSTSNNRLDSGDSFAGFLIG